MQNSDAEEVNAAPHVPVMMAEILAQLASGAVRTYVDGTLGAGGHAAAILHAHPECQMLVGGDQDTSALSLAGERLGHLQLAHQPKIVLLHTNYADLPSRLHSMGVKADAILLDLGVSSMQLDQPERGFSFRADGPLDMRMDTSCGLTAADICMTWSESDLRELFWKLGEEPKGRAAARAIVEGRRKKRIVTTMDLVEVLQTCLKRQGPTHPCTRVFQALRMAVNDELGVLERSLGPLAETLAPGGKLLVITFHSLEDRVVKFAFRELAKQHGFEILTKKPLEPSVGEVRQNRRARSAKLRVLKKPDESSATMGS
jgi:16S rRNA (cytosine1402-N4)-methyltransferase